MRRRPMLVALLLGMLSPFLMDAAPAAESPADGVPSDVPVYAEVAPGAVRKIVRFLALPPVVKLFAPEMEGPFSYLDEALELPPGTARKAVDHLQGLAFFGYGGEEVAFIFAFDEETWPTTLLGDAQGTVRVFPDGDGAGLARGKTLTVGTVEICHRAAAGDFAPLSGTPRFTAARRRAGDAVVWLCGSFQELLKLERDKLSEWERAEFDLGMKVLGAGHIEDVLFTVNSAEDGGSLNWTMHLDDEVDGVLALVPTGGLDVAADLPEGAAAAVALDWGDAGDFFGGARDVVLRVATEADPNGGARAEFDRKIIEVETLLGMSLDDFLGLFGSGVSGYLKAPAGGAMIGREDWVATLRLRNPDGFKAVLDRVLTNVTGQAPPPPVNDQGLIVHTLPMAPMVYTMTADGAVVGGSTDAIRRHLAWKSSPAPKTLLKEVPRARAMVRLDTGLLLTSYPTPLSSAKLELMAGRQGNELHVTLKLSDVEPGSIAANPVTMVGVAGLAAAVMIPAASEARGSARRFADASNLHNIGVAIRMYRVDHDGKYPPNLKALLDGGYIDGAESFISPADDAPPMRNGLRTSYVYVGDMPLGVGAEPIICYTRKGILREGGRNILCVDGSVLFAGERALANPRGERRSSLRASYELVVEAYGDALTDERKKQLKEFYEVK